MNPLQLASGVRNGYGAPARLPQQRLGQVSPAMQGTIQGLGTSAALMGGGALALLNIKGMSGSKKTALGVLGGGLLLGGAVALYQTFA